MWDKAAGAELKAFREDRRWSQSQLAEELGCDQATISRIEAGAPPNRSVRRLIDILYADRHQADPAGAQSGEAA